MYGFAALGPAVGFILGGYFLTIYVDFARVDMDEWVHRITPAATLQMS